MSALTLAFLAGIVLIQQLTELPSLNGIIAGGIFAIFALWKRYGVLSCFILGMVWAAGFAQYRLSERLSKDLDGKEFNITGYVLSLPEQIPHRATFDFQITPTIENLPAKVRLSWYEPTQTVKAGQQWQFTVKLKRPHGMFNPGGFDYETWLFSQAIGATGYIRKPEPHLLGISNSLFNINGWRQTISMQLSRLLPKSDSLGLIKALSIGDGNEVSDAQWQVFRKTGTIHLMVISGSHISLVAGMVFFLLRKLWARTGILAISPPTAAAAGAFTAALFYSALAGFSVPTQRAMIMVAVVMLGIIFQRHIRLVDTLALALLLVLLLDPLAVLSPGFWLSFVAVIIIVYCNANHLGNPSRFFPLVNIHFILTLGLAPLLLLFFQQMSLISPLANFVAVPVVELLLVPLILIALSLMFWLPFLATKLLWLVSELLQGLYWLLNELANLSFAIWNHPQPSGWAVLLALLGMMLLFAPRGIPARGLSVIFCLPLMFGQTEKITAGEFNLTLLDVGQGLSAVLQTTNHILVFDTGAKSSADFDMGKAVILPFLQNSGATKIDRLIISHGDNDHIGGAQSLLTGIKIDSVYTSVPDKFPDNAPVMCVAGQQWQWDKVNFTMLSPSENKFASGNDNSCVLKVESANGSVLLTGDIEAEAEQALVTAGTELKTDVLIAAHHGSKTSSTVEFLQKTKPELILIPTAYKNRYRFPHPSVIKRYQNQQINWLMTGTAGAIKVKITQSGLETFSYRKSHAKYWHEKYVQQFAKVIKFTTNKKRLKPRQKATGFRSSNGKGLLCNNCGLGCDKSCTNSRISS